MTKFQRVPLILLFLFVLGQHCNANPSWKQLETSLIELEIDLKQLDADLARGLAYGWREDARDKLKEWRESLSQTLSKFRENLSKFFKNLTTRDGDRLPSWVYESAGGALDEVVKYLEERMSQEDDHLRSVLLEVLRNTVRIYRNKVKSAANQNPEPESKPGPQPEPEPEPVPSEEL